MTDRRLLWLGLLLTGLCALYLGWHLRQPMGFILTLRGTKLAALILVGAATGAATIIFQTIAANRLLTPGIVGFDSLFVFLQTMLVLVLGGVGYSDLPAIPLFLAETAILTLAATVLFGLLLRNGADDIIRMILTGVILGVLLRGLANFGQRLLDPSEFAVVQAATFATFNSVDKNQLGIAAVVLALSLVAAWRLAPFLDVAALGRVKARTLGLHHDRVVFLSLLVIAAMIAVSTALVGPITFLGLLSASLAHAVLKGHDHRVLIPAAAGIGATILVAGQFIFERVLGMDSALAVIVEFLGGLLFLVLVLKRSRI